MIGFGLGPANPDAFFTALGQRDDWEELTFGGALLLGYYTVLTHPNVSRTGAGSSVPAERMMLAQGANIELVPGGFRQFGPILRRYAPRVMTAQAAPPDADGTVNLSLHLGATYEELVMAGRDPDRLLVIEVNPNLPSDLLARPGVHQHPADRPHRRDGGGRRRPRTPSARPRPTTSTRPSPSGPGRSSPTGSHPADRHRGRAQHGGLPAGRRAPVAPTGSTARCSPTA
jgi:hypothetical protein